MKNIIDVPIELDKLINEINSMEQGVKDHMSKVPNILKPELQRSLDYCVAVRECIEQAKRKTATHLLGFVESVI